jgi:hypothetical protein
MIVTSNLPCGALTPVRLPRTLLAAAMDVEWSKNYRIRGGSVPFCYSVVWLHIAVNGSGADLDLGRFWYRSAYVRDAGQTAGLVADADRALARVAANADLIAGHQLCSDLAVLAAAAAAPSPAVSAAQAAWRQRRVARPGGPRFLDTRYDTGHVLSGVSRRLVDVCTELRLDVTQPELRGTSMTALHRRWLERGDTLARQKITVLNLRHALSTLLVALHAAGLGNWRPGLNVNQLLADRLDGALGWLADPAFTALLDHPDAA